jgi:hypothetical protein
MAQQVQTTTIDDLEKKRGREVPADETLTFGIEGKQYRIDLTTENADKLRRKFAPYTEVATRVSLNGGSKPRPVSARNRSAEIRTWAKTQGFEVSHRGRIPAEIVTKYEASH